MGFFKCLWPFCMFVALHFGDLLSHINIVHSDSSNFSILCGIDGCTSQYNKYNSLHRHVSRKHPSWLEKTHSSQQSNDLQSQVLVPAQLISTEGFQSSPCPADFHTNNGQDSDETRCQMDDFQDDDDEENDEKNSTEKYKRSFKHTCAMYSTRYSIISQGGGVLLHIYK